VMAACCCAGGSDAICAMSACISGGKAMPAGMEGGVRWGRGTF
jgi:hypothetical protein